MMHLHHGVMLARSSTVQRISRPAAGPVGWPNGINESSMMTSTLREREVNLHGVGSRCLFSDVNEPGSHISNRTGHLIRIPEEEVRPGHSPMIEIRGKEPVFVTKLSDDPFVPVSKARLIAADLDLQLNF